MNGLLFCMDLAFEKRKNQREAKVTEEGNAEIPGRTVHGCVIAFIRNPDLQQKAVKSHIESSFLWRESGKQRKNNREQHCNEVQGI